ncbi:MAG TPA: dual specificity protein phosphatase family protein [Anaerolineae bacterium]|nr:dual specificity protein phosphatase family protein [Anaerolineae bacterium]HQI85884.1 dual specificity protein phosphatase family protein [Anaerolineae bacterium]
MQHIYWILDRILAGRPGPVRAPWRPAEFYAGGIRAVVSLAAEEPVEDLREYGLEHFKAEFPPVFLFSVGMRKAFIHEALPVWNFIHPRLEAGTPVLVHCHAGCDRTGLILAGYLVIYRHLLPEAAIAQVRAANSCALGAPGYAEAVALLRPGQIPDPKTLL